MDRLEEHGEEVLDAAADALDGAPVRTSLVSGRPSAAILEYASDHDAGLLAMGTTEDAASIGS